MVAALICGSRSEARSLFPLVVPLQSVIGVPNVRRADVNVMVKSVRGRPAYKIQCRSSSYGDAEFEYSGDFECRMVPVGAVTKYSTLFTEDPNQSRDWESRARFFSADLRGDCARIPEFGAVRHFKLRGMVVTLQVLHPTFGPNGLLDSLTLKVAVQPSPSSQQPIAAGVPFPVSPPAQCEIERNFPRPRH
jgi:hypothetical protein